jgi:2-polyprenyl-6-methoxyphenol hydroxylase-like FAD-dependent oxidoreductase
MSERRILIAGAGIAGCALALALRRAGFEVEANEARPAPNDTAGAFLNVAPNGLAVLRVLGVAPIESSGGFENDRLVFFNERGRRLANVAVGGVTLMRGTLSRVLREAAIAAGATFRFGKRLIGADEGAARVHARFEDGSIGEGEALIGADGIHSNLRSAVLRQAPQPLYTGVLNLGGVVRTDLAPTGTAMHMVFGRRAFFGYAVRPAGETYWFSNYALATEPPPDFAGAPSRLYRSHLLDLHRDDPAAVRTILEAIDGDIGAYPIYEMPPLPSWHRGRIGLIGDAAHAIGPHVGQGASLALEDAFELARCLRDHVDPAIAFSAFERLRRPRIDVVVRQSRRTGAQKAPAGWLGRRVRDLVLPLFLRKGAHDAGRLYAYAPDWNARAPLSRRSFTKAVT